MVRRLLALAFVALMINGGGSAKAQDWSDYLHWPYTPPQVPANGFEYKSLYDGWHVYPREMRYYPAVKGKLYYNDLAGQSRFGKRQQPNLTTPWNYRVFGWGIPGPINFSTPQRFYYGHHYDLDVF